MAKAYIIENTREEAINLAKKFLHEGKIKSYSKFKKIVSHKSRSTGKIYYKYEIECIE